MSNYAEIKKIIKNLFNEKDMMIYFCLSLVLFYVIFNSYFFKLGFKFDTIETQYLWGKSFFENPISFWRNYSGFLDYQFLGIFLDAIFYAFSLLFSGSNLAFVNTIRIVSVFSAFIFVIISYKNLKKRNTRAEAILYSLSFIFLPIFFFTSIIWGQFDILLILNIISMLYCIEKFKEKDIYKIILGLNICVALFIKMQSIIILPAIVVYLFIKYGSLKKILLNFYEKSFLLSFGAGLVLGLFLPLYINFVRTLYTLFQPFLRAEEFSSGGYNIWFLFVQNPYSSSKTLTLSGVTFSPSLVVYIVLFTAFLAIYFLYRKREVRLDFLYGMSAISALLYFLFATKMHSRYSLLGIVLLYFYITYSTIKKSVLLIIALILLNISYFINQYDIFNYWYPTEINASIQNLYNLLNIPQLTSYNFAVYLYIFSVCLIILQFILPRKIKEI